MEVDRRLGKLRVAWRVVSILALLGVVAGLGLVVAGFPTTKAILAADPCAGGFDNMFTRLAWYSFLGGVSLSAALLVTALIMRDRRAVKTSVIALAGALVALFCGMFLAISAYGWRCTEY
jgi:cytochrome bd-type quinol oxidase subunit 2